MIGRFAAGEPNLLGATYRDLTEPEGSTLPSFSSISGRRLADRAKAQNNLPIDHR
jgi:hypothetical protein